LELILELITWQTIQDLVISFIIKKPVTERN